MKLSLFQTLRSHFDEGLIVLHGHMGLIMGIIAQLCFDTYPREFVRRLIVKQLKAETCFFEQMEAHHH